MGLCCSQKRTTRQSSVPYISSEESEKDEEVHPVVELKPSADTEVAGELSAETLAVKPSAIEVKESAQSLDDVERANREARERAEQEALERARQEELERARQEELERARQEELERARQEALERSKQEELERAKQEELESAKQEEEPESAKQEEEPERADEDSLSLASLDSLDELERARLAAAELARRKRMIRDALLLLFFIVGVSATMYYFIYSPVTSPKTHSAVSFICRLKKRK
ncbi:eukaryotic translation initiation factor 4 gamma-like [Gigantopelta aegis]|uniref:eukaryotic translation initiation factor 4 gamma-like n=1 Tax=Gigantopelta aegis TaxID=1735272 RepID=UPI001B88E6E9|nr:eukaryotic translation initiation factor 4 gamma-like [Gigantopelta aegis]